VVFFFYEIKKKATVQLAFVSDGPERFEHSREFQAECEKVWGQICEKYAEDYIRSGFFRRLLIRHRMRREYYAQMSKVTPSNRCLWFGAIKVFAPKPKQQR
jgi:hypothetical protein